MPKVTKNTLEALTICLKRVVDSNVAFNARALNKLVTKNLRKMQDNNKSCPGKSRITDVMRNEEGERVTEIVTVLVESNPSCIAALRAEPLQLFPVGWKFSLESVSLTDDRVQTSKELKKLEATEENESEAEIRADKLMTDTRKILVLGTTFQFIVVTFNKRLKGAKRRLFKTLLWVMDGTIVYHPIRAGALIKCSSLVTAQITCNKLDQMLKEDDEFTGTFSFKTVTSAVFKQLKGE